MGFSVKMPANQVGSPKKSWDFRGYGLPEVWFMGVSTVLVDDSLTPGNAVIVQWLWIINVATSL